MRVMGQKPMKTSEFAQYVRDVRSLLSGKETEVGYAGRQGYTRFLNRGHGFVDLEHSIPIVVGANGPHALAVAGALGDGLMTIAATQPDDVKAALRRGSGWSIGFGPCDAGRVHRYVDDECRCLGTR